MNTRTLINRFAALGLAPRRRTSTADEAALTWTAS